MSKHRPLATITRSPLFPPGFHSPAAFKAWTDANYSTFLSLTHGGAVIPFSSLQGKGSITAKEHFRYLQLKHCIGSWLKKSPPPRQLTTFEQTCHLNPHKRGIVSIIYRSLNIPQSHQPPPYVRKWEKDLEVSLPEASWRASWEAIAHSSYNVTTLEANYKVLLRWYLTPDRVARFDPSHSSSCFRACPDIGTFFHTWWSCGVAQAFWGKISSLIHQLTQISLPICPQSFLLLILPPHIPATHKKLICHILNAAKQTLAKAWYSPTIEIHEVYTRLSGVMIMEKCTAILADSVKQFQQTWDPWIRQKDKYHVLKSPAHLASSPDQPDP